MQNNNDIELKDFGAAYEEIKAILSRTSSASIITRSTKILHKIYHEGFSQDGIVYVPWIPLALIEWSLVFCPKPEILLTTEINDVGYNKLYNLLHDSGAGFEKYLNSEHSFGVMKFMRCIAYQQFWFQGGKGQLRSYIGRNLFLMNKFNEDFLRYTGIPIKDFYEMLFVAFSRFGKSENGHIIDKSFFRHLSQKYTQNQVDLFFNLLALPLGDLQDRIREHHEYYEENFDIQTLLSQMTPLWRYPFLKIDGQYVCFYPSLIEYAMKFFVYDYLKLQNAQSFGRRFGSVMERYVEKGLKYLNVKFLNEKQIQEIVKPFRTKKQGKIKCVDFVVEQKNGTLLIESKASEMPVQVRVNNDDEILRKHFSSGERHVFHGIVQAYELCNFLVNEKKHQTLNLNKDFYLIIVTYKDFYLSSGEDFWNEFVKGIVKPCIEKKGIDENLIKPENIFIIPIDEYDRLINQVKESGIEIIDLLDYAIKRHKDKKTMRFTLGAHIYEYNPQNFGQYLPHLEKEYNELSQGIVDAIRYSMRGEVV